MTKTLFRFAFYEGTSDDFWEEEMEIYAETEAEAWELAEINAKQEEIWEEYEFLRLKDDEDEEDDE
jgi:hypothetical protein